MEVRRLQRIAVGPLTLDRRLRAGQWRHLTEREVDSLRQACRKAGWQSKGENEGESMSDLLAKLQAGDAHFSKGSASSRGLLRSITIRRPS